ncbi:hypothetical protein ABZ114_08300 [Streptomyces albidoflavus]|uniref:hypothetical protein n=1 Tax=Streptomyces albidoflavus TaxID=1886 RepID=UPI0033AD3581
MQRYDQRVRAFVEVRGGEGDWELAGERFAAHGWPVRDSAPAGEGPLGDAVEARPDSRVYEIEVRLPGIAKGADLGAARRVAKALRAARVEGYVRRAEVLYRDRERPSYWRAVDTSARPRPAGWAQAHTWYRVRLGLGLADREALLHAESGQALRLARAGRGAEASLTGVRPLDGRWRHPAGRLPEELLERRLWVFFLWALAAAGTLPFLAGRTGWPRAFWLVASGVCVVGALRAGARLSSPRRLGDVVLAILVLVFFALVVTGRLGGEPVGRAHVAFAAVVVLVVVGLAMLVRQWSWGEWVAWAVPLAATLAVSTLVAAGSVLHALYALGFGLAPGDLDVPPIWKALAAVKLLTLMSLALALPALWGLARHRHHSYAAPGESFNFLLWPFMLLLTLAALTALVLDTAEDAVARTTKAAGQGAAPPPFFGVQPDWTCVRPVIPAAGLPGEGPPLDPARPYLSFGVAGGNAVLWDAEAEEPVKVPASKVRLVPAERADQVCRGV